MLSEAESRAQCQSYLASFRVIELKELLKSMGCSQRGKKPELFQRCTDLVGCGSPKAQNKIREIFGKVHSVKKHMRFSGYCPRETSVPSFSSQAYVVHPDVKFKEGPFFRRVEVIVKPTALVSAAKSGLSMRLHFYLTPQQVQQVYLSKTAQGTYQIQVLLRFCRQETSCEQEDYYPRSCYLKVNDQYCPLPSYSPHLSSRPDCKRNGSPVNITNYVKTSASQANDIVIYWAHDVTRMGFCVCVELAKTLSSSELLQNLKAKGLRSPEVSRALVKEKLAVDKDSEIAATSLRVSLLCPLGKMRMQHPCRAKSCNHLQCFDASIYLQMNERKARWVCPVCDKPAPLTDLVIDGMFKEICETSPSNNIVFSSDGSWHANTEEKGVASNLVTPDRSATVNLDTPPPEITARGSNGGRSPVVIDLTASSDEESGGDEEEEEEEEDDEEDEEDIPFTRSRRHIWSSERPRLPSPVSSTTHPRDHARHQPAARHTYPQRSRHSHHQLVEMTADFLRQAGTRLSSSYSGDWASGDTVGDSSTSQQQGRPTSVIVQQGTNFQSEWGVGSSGSQSRTSHGHTHTHSHRHNHRSHIAPYHLHSKDRSQRMSDSQAGTYTKDGPSSVFGKRMPSDDHLFNQAMIASPENSGFISLVD